jgi:hypothetical protein
MHCNMALSSSWEALIGFPNYRPHIKENDHV